MQRSSDNRLEGVLDHLRVVSLIAVVIGGVGAIGLFLGAGGSKSRLLLVLFVIWMLSPFVALAWANIVSKHWAVLTRATLYGSTLILTLASLAAYGGFISPPEKSPRAFMFVVVAPLSWLLMVIVVPIAALISRRR